MKEKYYVMDTETGLLWQSQAPDVRTLRISEEFVQSQFATFFYNREEAYATADNLRRNLCDWDGNELRNPERIVVVKMCFEQQ